MIRNNDRLRFASYVRVEPSGCHIWTGGISNWGYGKFTVKRKTISSHRYAYIQAKGEIPEGLHIDHLCRNRACCNPDHLEAVTCRENLLRGKTFQAENAAKTHCPHGHPYNEENTRIHNGRRHCKACASAYAKRRHARPEVRERRRQQKRAYYAAKKLRSSSQG